MTRPVTRKIGGLKKHKQKNIKIPRYRDTGMAWPDTREIGGLKKKKNKKNKRGGGKKEKVKHKSWDGKASYMENRRTKKKTKKKKKVN